MTDREKAVVMAYTGVCMLKGDKLGVYYKYLEEIMGGPVTTLDIAILAEDIKHRAKPDFLRLCAEDGHAGTDVAPKSAWISVDERLPEPRKAVLVFCRNEFNTFQSVSEMLDKNGRQWSAVCGIPVTHWMPLPELPITDKYSQE